MTTSTKCAHPACQCSVGANGPFGKYCSEHCKEAGELSELRCECGHPGCN
jgi:hypothetical protein